MNQTATFQGVGTKKEAREQIKLEFAQYLEQQPETSRIFHRWMKRFEWASLGIMLAVFIVAMVVSFNWKNVPQISIPVAWFFYAASLTPTMLLVGLHAIVLRAVPPAILPNKTQKLVTGRKALWAGLGLILLGLIAGAFWGFMAYATWTLNWAMLIPLINILGITFGYGIAISILYSMIYKIFKSFQKVFKAR